MSFFSFYQVLGLFGDDYPGIFESLLFSSLIAAVDPVAARIAVPPTANCPDAGIFDPYVKSIGTPIIDAAADVIEILFKRRARDANGPS